MGATDSITLNRILSTAAGWHASDLHFVIGNPPVVRVDGKLVTLDDEPICSPEFIESVGATLLTDDQRRQLLERKEVAVGFSLNQEIRFKVSAVYQRGSLAITLHFIPTKAKRIEELGLPESVLEFTTMSKGLVLITGPYGSGRTSTLNAIITHINQNRAANIVTIEQPIEFQFVNDKSIIEQREVGRDALTPEQAIITASREDVDVIVVAEANSPAVIMAMLDAAEASRLVMSTMSTDSVLVTIEKILNSFPAEDIVKVRTQLSAVLAGIVSQRLLPKVGGGQVVVAEIMIPSAPIRSVIRDGALTQLANVLQTSRQGGSISFDRSLAKMVKDGMITKEDAMLNALDPSSLRLTQT